MNPYRKFFRDPKTYPEPLAFKPERFLGPEKQYDPRKYLYGYGRRYVVLEQINFHDILTLQYDSARRARICPGEALFSYCSTEPSFADFVRHLSGLHLADASMWLACVSVIAAFDIAPPVKDGQPVMPSGKFIDGGIRYVLVLLSSLSYILRPAIAVFALQGGVC
jgi:hypothetical protein